MLNRFKTQKKFALVDRTKFHLDQQSTLEQEPLDRELRYMLLESPKISWQGRWVEWRGRVLKYPHLSW